MLSAADELEAAVAAEEEEEEEAEGEEEDGLLARLAYMALA